MNTKLYIKAASKWLGIDTSKSNFLLPESGAAGDSAQRSPTSDGMWS